MKFPCLVPFSILNCVVVVPSLIIQEYTRLLFNQYQKSDKVPFSRS